jgi:hypothetical protein
VVAGTESAAARVDALERTRVRVSPAVALAGIVVVSIGLRLLLAWARSTANLFPDEYIYTELSRSIASSGLPEIRGHVANFPSLLGPLLTAPAWLIHDTVLAYRIAQAIGVVAMSLAAIPAYLLARRVRLGAGAALGIAAAAVAVPDFLYTSYLVAEPFAYPLVLAATAAGVAALERPTRQRQGVFLALAFLAALARVQFIVLPVAFLVAVVAVGLRERRLRRTLREHALLLGVVVLGAAALAVVGLGFYGRVVHASLAPGPLLHSVGHNLLVLAFAAGWVVVPGAIVGLVLAVAKPVDRTELAFATLAGALALGVLGETVLYGGDAHERYLVYVAPFLFVAFALYARRGFPHKLVHASCAVLLVAGATRLPLSGILGIAHSPVLLALTSIGGHVGGNGNASTIALDVVLAGTALLLLLARVPRLAATFALTFTVALGLVTWYAAASFDRDNTRKLSHDNLPAGRTWVDAHGLDHVALVEPYGGRQIAGFDQLFWNRSIDTELVLPGGAPIDPFSVGPVADARDGTMLVGGKPVVQPLLIDGWGGTVRLRGARLVQSAAGFDLWQPTGTPRLELYYGGRYPDGWLGTFAWIDLWPDRAGLAGRLAFDLALPSASRPVTVELASRGSARRTLTLRSGRTQHVELTVCSSKRWQVVLRASGSGAVGTRVVSTRSTVPVFRQDPGACASASA